MIYTHDMLIGRNENAAEDGSIDHKSSFALSHKPDIQNEMSEFASHIHLGFWDTWKFDLFTIRKQLTHDLLFTFDWYCFKISFKSIWINGGKFLIQNVYVSI